MKIIVIGEQLRAAVLKERIVAPNIEIDYSDGDTDESYEEYDVIFDLNFDDDPSNFPIYASLKNKLVFVSAVKLSLNEVAYTLEGKIKCKLFGINAIPEFLANKVWEVSAYRKFEIQDAEKFATEAGLEIIIVEDRVGLVKPRIVFMIINEAAFTLQEGTASIEDIDLGMKLGTNYPYGPFEWCDKIGITNVFETLMAIYEDTKDERYKICPLLKTKYLRNETFYKLKKSSE
jgi:3-hydroxybutyryl-CoA dehydrogenase